MPEDLYYRRSGELPVGATILASLAALAASLILAALYAALILYIPLAGWISFILTIGFGLGVGLAVGLGLRWAKVRNNTAAFAIGLSISVLALYASWTVWTFLVLRQADVDADLVAILTQPPVLWNLIVQINTVGAWSLSGFAPTGIVLWLLWALEVILVIVPCALAVMGILDAPFCERCERFADASEDVARFVYREPSEMREHLESTSADRLDALVRPGTPSVLDSVWIRADLKDCGQCGAFHTLTLKAVTVSVDSKGERNENEEEVVENFLLTTEESKQIRIAGEELVD